MTSIDVSRYNLKYWNSGSDIAVATQASLPQCSSSFRLRGGPTLAQIATHLGTKVSHQISARMGLFAARGENAHVELAEKVPLVFMSDEGGAVGIIVSSLSLDPDPQAYLVAIEGRDTTLLTGIGLTGWCVRLDDNKRINQMEPKRCLVFYRPEEHQGWVGIVAEHPQTPRTQVISGAESFAGILRTHFRGGFVEVFAPDGATRWGVLNYFDTSQARVSVKALRNPKGSWRFNRRSVDELNVYSAGSSFWTGGMDGRLLGDLLLCADGTLLHNYYVSQQDVEWWYKRNPEGKWYTGHYFERFYPLGSSLVPTDVIDSFNRDTPDWYEQETLLTREQR